jgi:hypothetical protein
MAESLLVRKGGGGAKIEEIVKEYIVASGQTITAGTFVDSVSQEINFTNSTVEELNIFMAIIQVVALTPTKVLATYFTNITNTFVARVFTISGNTVTPHDVFDLNINTGVRIVALDETRAAIVYPNNASGNFLTGRVLSVNGTTITGGNAQALNSLAVSASWLSLSLMSKNPFRLAVAGVRSSAGTGYARILSVNETFISTEASEVSFATNFNNTSQVQILGLSNERALLTFRGINNHQYIKTIFNGGGGETTVSTLPLGELRLIALQDNLALVSYTYESGENGVARVVTITYTGTVNVNTSEFYYHSEITRTPRITKLETFNENTTSANTNLLVFYRTGGAPPNTLVGRVLNVSHNFPYAITTPYNSIVYRNEQTPQTDVVALKNTKALVLFTTPANLGLTTIFEKPVAIVNTTNEKVFGLAKTGGTAGQTIEVFVNE